MDLINDLGTELAFAFLVEKRYRQKIDSAEAMRLISSIRNLLESASATASRDPDASHLDKENRTFSAH
jgi:hypothetical protein